MRKPKSLGADPASVIAGPLDQLCSVSEKLKPTYHQ